MGSFSFLYADRDINSDKKANITYGDKVKVLIPEEFGGGCFSGEYLDYGRVKNKEKEIDLYTFLAITNEPKLYEKLKTVLLDIDKSPEKNNEVRSRGIEIGCYDEQMAKLKYPLKIVKKDTNKTYEKIKDISFVDSEQGFYKYTWKKLDDLKHRRGLNNTEYSNLMYIKGNKKLEELVISFMEYLDREFDKYKEDNINVYTMTADEKIEFFVKDKDNEDLSDIGVAYTTRDFILDEEEIEEVDYQVILDLKTIEFKYYLDWKLAETEKIEMQNFNRIRFDDWLVDLKEENIRKILKSEDKIIEKPKKKEKELER